MIRPESRWWLLTLAVVAVLVGISFLALDRPDVDWSAGSPLCPHCRLAVEPFGTRCPHCDQQFDWVASPEGASPYSPWSLSAPEAEKLRARVQVLGEEEAARRVAAAVALTPDAAERYVAAVGRGRCGWCGGTGEDLGDANGPGEGVCPVCLGRKWCVACGGDRRIRIGDRAARQALETYAAGLGDVAPTLSLAAQRQEARRLNEAFIARHTGTIEAAYLVFWPDWKAGEAVWVHVGPDEWPLAPLEAPFWQARFTRDATSGVEAARDRLGRVLEALAGEGGA